MFFWANKAAEQNYPDGIAALGICYGLGTGCEQSKDKAHELIEKGYNMGSTYGIFAVGDCSENGIFGYPKDPEKQFEYMLKAAERGYPEAMGNLADLYEDMGESEKAQEWADKAAEFEHDE